MSPQQLSSEALEHLLTLEAPEEAPFFSPSDSPLLRLLSAVDRDLLNTLLTEHHFERGDVICAEGEPGDAMYLIRSGQVVVIKGEIDSPTVLGYRGPGEIIGEMALLEGQPRSATNIAVDRTRLLKIDRAGFQELVSVNPAIGMTIMSTLSARLRIADDVRATAIEGGKRLVKQVTRLQTEKEHLLELQRVRQETSDLVVHDLRNPLGIIYGALNMLEMVLPEDVLEDNRELVTLATTASERMQRLVDSLLDVAKLETGEMPLALARLNLSPILEDAAHRQGITAQSRNVSIRVDAADDLPPILNDTEKIERVIANLLDNALKFTPNNHTIVIVAKRDNDVIIVSVIDGGPGIPEEERERIFERFTQVAGSSPSRRGFGLGLTFCRLTVEAHGGEIWVEPGANGVGSRFAFTLPVKTQFTD
ncbi:MAG: cyclic nucleotide-binding domain-containing protein [Anaerolineae bacterium]|nr:cyclic nucleotide-binding domain-containing protein [Anaerolineae bacterium]